MKKRLISMALVGALLAPMGAGAVAVQVPANLIITNPTEQAPAAPVTASQVADFLAAQDGTPTQAGSLAFGEIESLVRSYNLTILASQQIIPGKQALVKEGIKDLEDAIEDLEDGIDGLEDAVEQYDEMIEVYTDLAESSGDAAAGLAALPPELATLSGFFAALFGTDAALSGGLAGLLTSDQMTLEAQLEQLEEQLDTLEEQLEELEDTDFTDAERELAAGFDQLVMGAQSLYIGLHTMQAGYDALVRQEEIVKTQLTEMEKRYELGQISAVDLASVRDALRELTRSKENLAVTIRNSKGDLNLLLGRDSNLDFTLLDLPTVELSTLMQMDLQRDLSFALANSQQIDKAKQAVEDAEDGEEADRKYNIRQAEYQMQSTENSFRQNFVKLFRAVEDAVRALQAKSDARGFVITKLNVARTKYQLGQISYNDYVDAQNELVQADADVKTAQNDLFQAYHTYQWAVRGVIAAGNGGV